MTDAVTAIPDVPGLGQVTVTVDSVQQWLVTDGLRILVTIVLAALAIAVLHRLIDRVVATMTSKSARRLAESGRAGRVLASATGMANERQHQRVETVGSLLRSIVRSWALPGTPGKAAMGRPVVRERRTRFCLLQASQGSEDVEGAGQKVIAGHGHSSSTVSAL